MKINKPEIREVQIIRYVQPFREGGSLPALVDADDGFSYVIKFRGAGQGKKALVAELIGGELARFLGLRMPEMVFAELDESFARTEPDEEIQDLLRFSVGKNLGVHFLNGAITFDA
ncbi:MAG TPA: aminotransferase class I and II, partial [Sphingobacterium sp.]|nr:aminotransferase class I and II [Sphingobacterium sp.]